MNELTCQVCMDLIPLVQDGVASEESRAAVEAHVAGCPACRALFEGRPAARPDEGERLWSGLANRLRFAAALLLMLAIFIGVSLANTEEQFYNILLMPAIGALGYGVFRWKALWNVPILLLFVHAALFLLDLFRETREIFGFDVVWWTVMFSLFSAVGTVIAGLMHFALKKEERNEET